MAGWLADDGTMDTVIVCDVCGEEERFTFEPDLSQPKMTAQEEEQEYDAFVEQCIQDFDAGHECEQ